MQRESYECGTLLWRTNVDLRVNIEVILSSNLYSLVIRKLNFLAECMQNRFISPKAKSSDFVKIPCEDHTQHGAHFM